MKWQKEQTKTDRKLFWGDKKNFKQTKSFKPSMFLRQSEMILSSPDNVKTKQGRTCGNLKKSACFEKENIGELKRKSRKYFRLEQDQVKTEDTKEIVTN